MINLHEWLFRFAADGFFILCLNMFMYVVTPNIDTGGVFHLFLVHIYICIFFHLKDIYILYIFYLQ